MNLHYSKLIYRSFENCLSYWKKLSVITSAHYKEVPYVEGYKSPLNAFKDARYFSWGKYLLQVERDIQLAKEIIP